jgi:NTP pyrophosphatase (non-canonical NTP hydrolase)
MKQKPNTKVKKESSLECTYKNFVEKMCKPGRQVEKDLTSETAHMLHMAVGISGEVAELVDALTYFHNCDLECLSSVVPKQLLAHMEEELGDICFYSVGLQNSSGILVGSCDQLFVNCNQDKQSDLFYIYKDSMHVILCDMVVMAGYILNAVKRKAVYTDHEEFENNMREYLCELSTQICCFCTFVFGKPVPVILRKNMKKLQKRYPSGYSNVAAKTRKDKQ